VTCYVALDGPDGCGKSTQAAALATWLEAEGADVLHVREPGSTPVGEALRALLLSTETGDLLPITEALLFSAARAELAHRVVAPALAAGRVVVAERCYLSTAVYQLLAADRAARAGMDLSWFEDLTRRVQGACLPDTIFVLDVPDDVSARRRGRRTDPADRIEGREDAFHQRVREGYLAAAAREPRAVVLDAARSFDELQAELRARVTALAAGGAA
jgi:dTMP kinase